MVLSYRDETQKQHPRLIGSFGLYSSGSTWSYNVIYEILKDKYSSISRYFGNDINEDNINYLVKSDFVVVKSHSPSSSLLAICMLTRIPVVLTVRDPRDAIVSLMERFDYSFKEAFTEVISSAKYLTHIIENCQTLILKYEDGFIETPDTVARIANHIGVKISHEKIDSIFRNHRKGEIQEKINKFIQDGSVDSDRPRDQFEAATHWHPNHIGDGVVGKYDKKLTAEQIMSIEIAAKDFMDRFNYIFLTNGLPSGLEIVFNDTDLLGRSVAHGFYDPESWGMWARSTESMVSYPLMIPTVAWIQGYVDLTLAPAFFQDACQVGADIVVCGQVVATLRAGEVRAGEVRVTFAMSGDQLALNGRFEIIFRAKDVLSPFKLGLSDDDRELAVGVRKLMVLYGDQSPIQDGYVAGDDRAATIGSDIYQRFLDAQARADQLRDVSWQLDISQQKIATLTADNDALAQRLNAVEEERTEFSRQLHEVAADRDSLSERIGALTTERNDIIHEMKQRLNSAEGAQADILHKLQETAADREKLCEQNGALAAERERLSEQIGTLTAERDDLAQRMETQAHSLAQAKGQILKLNEDILDLSNTYATKTLADVMEMGGRWFVLAAYKLLAGRKPTESEMAEDLKDLRTGMPKLVLLGSIIERLGPALQTETLQSGMALQAYKTWRSNPLSFPLYRLHLRKDS